MYRAKSTNDSRRGDRDLHDSPGIDPMAVALRKVVRDRERGSRAEGMSIDDAAGHDRTRLEDRLIARRILARSIAIVTDLGPDRRATIAVQRKGL